MTENVNKDEKKYFIFFHSIASIIFCQMQRSEVFLMYVSLFKILQWTSLWNVLHFFNLGKISCLTN